MLVQLLLDRHLCGTYHCLLQGPHSLSIADGPMWLLGVLYARKSADEDSGADQEVPFVTITNFYSVLCCQ